MCEHGEHLMETQVPLPWSTAGHRTQPCPSLTTLLHFPPAKPQGNHERNPPAHSESIKAPRAVTVAAPGFFLHCLVHSPPSSPGPCSPSIASGDGFGAVAPRCEQNMRVQRRHSAKINAETGLEMFIFQLQAIHSVTPLCSSESPSVYIR